MSERTNEAAGAYAKACVAIAGQCGIQVVDLWTKMQQFPDWKNAYLRCSLFALFSCNFSHLWTWAGSVPGPLGCYTSIRKTIDMMWFMHLNYLRSSLFASFSCKFSHYAIVLHGPGLGWSPGLQLFLHLCQEDN